MDMFEGIQRNPQSLHKYTYASCNPISRTDPSGKIDASELAEVIAEGGEKALHGVAEALKAIGNGAEGAEALSGGIMNAGAGLFTSILEEKF